ncbi:thioesterase family protein [Natronoglycomyces albus]|uniref:Thioesterase family protein n=1 Tax=Natronoglycomyces albus TaxID=2811108 RepID=A0A895XQR7_9ACTN|nr:thioesterase family protein [Natronoglycomyces albus]QSB04896.1 thioesterase family protein [Natronoglycomyces albus]
MFYFDRLDAHTLRPTEHVSGAWAVKDQHIAPALGLMAHEVETDRDRRRDDGLRLSRLSYDILGPLPMEQFTIDTKVLRPGRTIELVECTITHAGRPTVVLRAWLMSTSDTSILEGTAYPRLRAPLEMPTWDPASIWQGGFIASAQVRREQIEPGRAQFWVNTDVPLLAEPVSPLARAAGMFDVANGLTVRVSPEEVAFPNVDLTAHLFRSPMDGWIGYDTTVSFGPQGHGLTHSTMHDEAGPFGVVSQSLTVRPLNP